MVQFTRMPAWMKSINMPTLKRIYGCATQVMREAVLWVVSRCDELATRLFKVPRALEKLKTLVTEADVCDFNTKVGAMMVTPSVCCGVTYMRGICKCVIWLSSAITCLQLPPVHPHSAPHYQTQKDELQAAMALIRLIELLREQGCSMGVLVTLLVDGVRSLAELHAQMHDDPRVAMALGVGLKRVHAFVAAVTAAASDDNA